MTELEIIVNILCNLASSIIYDAAKYGITWLTQDDIPLLKTFFNEAVTQWSSGEHSRLQYIKLFFDKDGLSAKPTLQLETTKLMVLIVATGSTEAKQALINQIVYDWEYRRYTEGFQFASLLPIKDCAADFVRCLDVAALSDELNRLRERTKNDIEDSKKEIIEQIKKSEQDLKEYITGGNYGFQLLDSVYLAPYKTLNSEIRFYDGHDPQWCDILQNRDFPRQLFEEQIGNILSTKPSIGPQVIWIKGHAKTGKSTFLLRLAYELSQSYLRKVFYHTSPAIVPEFDISNVRIYNKNIERFYIFVDDVGTKPNVEGFVKNIVSSPYPVTAIIGIRTSEWKENKYSYDELWNMTPKPKDVKNYIEKLVEVGRFDNNQKNSLYSSNLYKQADNDEGGFLELMYQITKSNSYKRAILNEYEYFEGNIKTVVAWLSLTRRYGVHMDSEVLSRCVGREILRAIHTNKPQGFPCVYRDGFKLANKLVAEWYYDCIYGSKSREELEEDYLDILKYYSNLTKLNENLTLDVYSLIVNLEENRLGVVHNKWINSADFESFLKNGNAELICLTLGPFYNENGNIEIALKVYTNISISYKSHYLYNNWGVVLYKLGKAQCDEELLKEACEKYAKAIEYKPADHEAYNNWGAALSNLGKAKGDEELFKEACEKYAKAIKYKPAYHEAYNNWGLALYDCFLLNKDVNVKLLFESKSKVEEALRIKKVDMYKNLMSFLNSEIEGLSCLKSILFYSNSH
ncbi:MAG: hypothetical protein L3V56_13605 [Candidatus Magnetoovum sp. WYHC-5]|nr:hypothetical protein [Candidatus Magnetoovum sp. WYHC-5]